MKLKSINTIERLLIIGGIIMMSFFALTFATEDDNSQVLDRVNVIQDSNTLSLPNVWLNQNKKWLISNVIERLFSSSGKIRSVFMAAFDGLSINTIPLWVWGRFVDSTLTQSWNTVNVGWDINILWDLTKYHL